MTEDQKREYDATLGALRHHQGLLHQSLAPFLTIGVALIGLAVISPFSRSLHVSACVLGLAASGLWLLIAIRMRIYNFNYAARLTALEGGEGHMTKDEALRARGFLACSPVIGDAVICCAVGYLMVFFYLLLHVSGLLGGAL